MVENAKNNKAGNYKPSPDGEEMVSSANLEVPLMKNIHLPPKNHVPVEWINIPK